MKLVETELVRALGPDAFTSGKGNCRLAQVYSLFFLAHEVLNSKAKFHHMSVYDIHPDTLGMFDLVFFLGVYYHLKNPILALERIASVTHEYAIIESQIMDPRTPDGEGIARFYEHDELSMTRPTGGYPMFPAFCRPFELLAFRAPNSLPATNPAVVSCTRTKGRALPGKC